ncbi:MAG: two-component system sensor histidine kinase NtrB [Alcanivoracaceae bacterium]
MEYLAELLVQLSQSKEGAAYLLISIIMMLVVILFLHKTYRASITVASRLAEFSSLTGNSFGNRMKLIETNADAFRLNRDALGPLARIIDEYCVVTTDVDGMITYCNSRFMSLTRVNQRDIVGRQEHFESIETDRQSSWTSVHARLSPERVWHGELCLAVPAGTVWLDCFVFPLPLITNNDSGYIFFGTDITSIKQHSQTLMNEVRQRDETISKMEGMLYNSEKMASLGVISAGIAHEINNPMAFVLSNVRQLNDRALTLCSALTALIDRIPGDQLDTAFSRIPPDGVRLQDIRIALGDVPDILEETFDGIDRIRKIIADLKCFSHSNQEHYTDVDANRCVDVSLSLARHETRNRVQVHRSHDGDAPIIPGSESQLTQVFLNLIVNAAQAMKEGGEIRLDSRFDCHQYVICIADSGPGIPEDVMVDIFEPFFTTKPSGEGTGLGLAISQDIIRRHGGSIGVESRPGEGTTFTVTLPAQKAFSSHAA